MSRYNFAFLLLSSIAAQSQSLDTLIDVGGYKLHFNVIEGKDTPILFEAGAGNDGSVWDDILAPIHEVTGTTLITYDRSGFGKSELNPNLKNNSDFGIVNGVEELEMGLKNLGYNDQIILVSHSYGNFYSTLFSARNPNKIKYAVMVDGNHVNSYTDEYIDKYIPNPEEVREAGLGFYYLIYNFQETVSLMRQTEFPGSIPAVDLIAGIPFSFMAEKEEWELVVKSHSDFVNARSNRKGFTAHGSAHYIFLDNPELVINTIIEAYTETLDLEQRGAILNRAIGNAIKLSIEAKKREVEYRHSEEDLNQWGYDLMQKGEIKKGLEIFRLNTTINPESWNAYNSYGDALMNGNQNDKAIEMYKRSIELNPGNANGKEALKKIKRD